MLTGTSDRDVDRYNGDLKVIGNLWIVARPEDWELLCLCWGDAGVRFSDNLKLMANL